MINIEYSIKTKFGQANIQSLRICKEITQLVPPMDDELVFNFMPYGENNPFSNLILINTLRKFKSTYPDADLRCKPKDIDGYLSHIGFYKACGISIGKEPGEARASSNYVPITDISLYGIDFYRTIETTATELAATLQFDSGLQEMLTYVIIETIRNVFEHAGTSNVLVAAQKWPKLNLVEIAIADAGCGIAGSLSKLYAVDSKDFLRLACQPGISARSNYSYIEKDNPWRNSGYGLYIMKELALAYKGSFILCSGDHAIRFSAEGDPEGKFHETYYSGTIIGLRFKTDTDNNFDDVRDEIVATGQKIAEKIKGAIRTASRSSGGRYHFGK